MIAIERNAAAACEYARCWNAGYISRQRQAISEKHQPESALEAQRSAGVINAPVDTVEISPEVQSLSKMVGVMEMLLLR
ncbi:MAG: hypothetical protein N3A66_09820 [Planctomycetota bacterium]|nr:hypothetical protein [Planctomycetota bacterium]